jgi:hypothetical protein
MSPLTLLTGVRAGGDSVEIFPWKIPLTFCGRFAVCPELICTLLFTSVLKENEVLFMRGTIYVVMFEFSHEISGCQQYSKYKGYAKSLEFDGDFRDPTPV